MIHPDELRLGNYVAVKNNGNDVIGKVFAIDAYLVSVDGGNNNYDYHLLEPVPLTEDILLKCGFEKTNCDFVFQNKEYDIFFDMKEDGGSCSDYNEGIEINHPYMSPYYDLVIRCVHLHRLQNKFYEITGKELEVKI